MVISVDVEGRHWTAISRDTASTNPVVLEGIRRPYGAQPGPFDDKCINVLRTFKLGTEEVLISGDGLGRVIVRNVRTIDKQPLCFNVGTSVWGLDVRNRLLAVSCNSHDVYLFNLESASADTTPSAQLHECVILRGACSNIPNVSISSNQKVIACVDITCQVTIWNLEEEVVHLKAGIVRAANMGLAYYQWDSAWSCTWIHRDSFRTVREGYLAKPINKSGVSNPVRSLLPKLDWWNSVGADVYPELQPTPGSPGFSMREVMLCLSFAQQGFSPEPEFESHWQKEKLADFISYVPVDLEDANPDLLLIATVDMVALLHSSNLKKIHAICYYPFGSKWTTGDNFERINMVKVLSNLGLVAIASQKGQVCILELVKHVDQTVGTRHASYSFRCHSIHPNIKDIPLEDGELLGMEFLAVASDQAELLMLFRSGRMHIVRFAVQNDLDLANVYV
ncbi:protein of unknown function [Taphrina deformans PYCC 5710]|uniref:Uncharacterized protein n=1 Tax=Taphrina deformans (strain PYCC 5710 / ATCC 11124 / CBS 356.35 / IMI 108563 / JCM 9778 / NBRC 8474) TaxID=1097556 RepID=R4XG98_TAPDE|nr:protein of unknown function [Taphrina deformans PYCC 5710]|eukprot:CCG84780.1 protein of unknown function [Taphrina deformans PYCC 5710]